MGGGGNKIIILGNGIGIEGMDWEGKLILVELCWKETCNRVLRIQFS